jgi:hypothetical protein
MAWFTKSAKPPPPVQIRAAPPIFTQEILVFGWLHLKWMEFVSLFGTKPERVTLLNEVAPGFGGARLALGQRSKSTTQCDDANPC